MDVKIENCVFPNNYLYDIDNFIWIKCLDSKDQVDGFNYILLGITPIYSYLAGRILKIKLKSIGDTIQKNKSIGTIESLKHFGIIRSPMSGIIEEINHKILDNPKIVNDSPFNLGWIAKIKSSDSIESLDTLKSIENCKDDVLSQIKMFNVKCFVLFPDFQMYELGTECSATLAKLGEFLTRNMKVGEVIRLVSDDPTADLEVSRWAEENKQEIVEIVMEKNPVQSSSFSNKGTNYLFNIIIKKTNNLEK